MGATPELEGVGGGPLLIILQGSAWAAPPPRTRPAPGVPGLRVSALGVTPACVPPSPQCLSLHTQHASPPHVHQTLSSPKGGLVCSFTFTLVACTALEPSVCPRRLCSQKEPSLCGPRVSLDSGEERQ